MMQVEFGKYEYFGVLGLFRVVGVLNKVFDGLDVVQWVYQQKMLEKGWYMEDWVKVNLVFVKEQVK